jgi:cytidine deaminase
MVIDWAGLRAGAAEAAQRAYAPYSRLRVGAAGQTADGRVIQGCNVENASYGLTLCAECGLVSALHATGGGTLVAVSVVSGDGQRLLPCGRCRQLLQEAGGPGLLVDTDGGPTELSNLLPAAFTATDLPATDLRATDLPATDLPATDLRATDLRATDLRATDLPAGGSQGG